MFLAPAEIVTLTGRVEVRSWIEMRSDGTAVGMGSRTVYDADGRLISHKVEPTGARLINVW